MTPCRCEPCPNKHKHSLIPGNENKIWVDDAIETCPTCQGQGRVMPEEIKLPCPHPECKDGRVRNNICSVCGGAGFRYGFTSSPPITDAEVEAAAKALLRRTLEMLDVDFGERNDGEMYAKQDIRAFLDSLEKNDG